MIGKVLNDTLLVEAGEIVSVETQALANVHLRSLESLTADCI